MFIHSFIILVLIDFALYFLIFLPLQNPLVQNGNPECCCSVPDIIMYLQDILAKLSN